ncbi:MAG: hypothetical protein JRI25_04640 [Deltaproteobacteria bacterium]|nr:hypothetical protein [Deltaproteobacteria bacterium]
MARNITLSADEVLIERARARARQQQTSLNAVFRRWLESYAAEQGARESYETLMARFDDVKAGRSFTRDEMNER